MDRKITVIIGLILVGTVATVPFIIDNPFSTNTSTDDTDDNNTNDNGPMNDTEDSQDMNMTELPVITLASLANETLNTLLRNYNMRDMSFALIKDGKLVYRQVYSFQSDGITNTSLFRIMGLSMPITSTAIMQLVESGSIALDDKVFTILDQYDTSAIKNFDSNILNITVSHLLHHVSGWDVAPTSGPWFNTINDPMFMDFTVAGDRNKSVPVSVDDIIGFVLSQPLDNVPGESFSLNYFGYVLLGKIIEKISGQSYVGYVQANIFDPLGIANMKMGRTQERFADPDEVVYHDAFTPSNCPSVVLNGKFAECAYGSTNIENLGAAAGWIASAIDLARFLVGVDQDPTVADVLESATITRMLENELNQEFTHNRYGYYGLGWQVNESDDGISYMHHGILLGTSGFMVQLPNNISWVILFNKHPVDKEISRRVDFQMDFRTRINDMISQIGLLSLWPDFDLFDEIIA